MKRLLATLGGRPIKNEDLQQYTQAFSIFEGLFSDLGIGDCIVYGCEITEDGDDQIYAPGVIFYNGELRIFEGLTDPASSILLAALDVDVDVRTFDDETSNATATEKKMVQDGDGDFTLSSSTSRTAEEVFGSTRTKTKSIVISDFNMVPASTYVNKSIAHGLTADQIVRVSVRIYPDSGSLLDGYVYDLAAPSDSSGANAGLSGLNWNDTQVWLYSYAGGFFDNIAFGSTDFRGYIDIDYTD